MEVERIEGLFELFGKKELSVGSKAPVLYEELLKLDKEIHAHASCAPNKECCIVNMVLEDMYRCLKFLLLEADVRKNSINKLFDEQTELIEILGKATQRIKKLENEIMKKDTTEEWINLEPDTEEWLAYKPSKERIKELMISWNKHWELPLSDYATLKEQFKAWYINHLDTPNREAMAHREAWDMLWKYDQLMQTALKKLKESK